MQAVPESTFEQDVQIQTVANPMGRRVDSEENQTLVTPPEGAEAENTQGGWGGTTKERADSVSKKGHLQQDQRRNPEGDQWRALHVLSQCSAKDKQQTLLLG